jgi:hypothetical protein
MLWPASPADDPSGCWRQALAWLDANHGAARVAAVAALCAELAMLAAACWLHSIHTAAYEAWLDDREEEAERAREVLARAVVRTYAGEAHAAPPTVAPSAILRAPLLPIRTAQSSW